MNFNNTLFIFSDRKMTGTYSGDSKDKSDVEMLSTTDYYPGGSIMPGRSFNAGTYRYGGAGGQEMDSEITGVGNSYTAEYWQYDSRLMRRWNVDPITYPWQSSYATFNNNPISFVDPLGLYGTKREAKRQRRIARKAGYETGAIDEVNGDFGFSAHKQNGDGTWDMAHYFENKLWTNSSASGGIVKNGNREVSYTGALLNGSMYFYEFEGSANLSMMNGRIYEQSNMGSFFPDGIKTSVNMGIEGGLVSGDFSVGVQNKGGGLEFSGQGSALSMEAILSGGYFDEANGRIGGGNQLDLGIYTAEGDLTVGSTILGMTLDVTIGASIASAHVGVNNLTYYDTKTGDIVITDLGHLGFGVGGKLGWSLRVPIKSWIEVYNNYDK